LSSAAAGTNPKEQGPSKRKMLGERLIDAGLVTHDQLDLALREQKRTGERVGEILINLGFVTQEQISAVLASQAGVAFVQLDNYLIEAAALKVIPEAMARRHKMIPILLEPPKLTVALANVFDVLAIDEVQRATGYVVDAVSSTESGILAAIDQYYAGGISIEEIVQKSIRQVEAGRLSEADLAAGAPIIRLVDQIFLSAVQDAATDIHMEPEERIFRIRFRVDGKLRMGPSLPKMLQPAVTARVKILSAMNIAETRQPQDGKINFFVGKRKIDLRVSTLPTVHGENLVLRVLDKSKLVLGLESLGFDDTTLARLRKAIESRNGIVTVCGPTGSGKTTTLYSALSYINSLDRSIITLEDPVEYELPIIRQCQINVKAGLTFASGLRSILRHDPDVILVGEMRDAETVELAVRAALTGHLVFSTLHTNDAAGAIPRLINMGQEPFLVASSLRAIVGQALIRLNCSACREEYKPSPETIERAGLPPESVHGIFLRGKGCDQCGKTGFRGRVGVYELMEVTPEIARMVMKRANSQDLLEAAMAQGMTPMRGDGVAKAMRGLTTLEEVVQLT
jgi:type IV pilus assembly protein PilB